MRVLPSEEEKEKQSKEKKHEKEHEKELKIKLKHILEVSKINHSVEIIKQSSLKQAHAYCKLYNLSGQMMGPLIEKYIQYKYGMTKNKASSCSGDLKSKTANLEIKASNGGKENNKFNYVQIRMNHNCEYIFTAYYLNNSNISDLGELFIFRLNKENLRPIIFKYGGYAHGTVRKLGRIKMNHLKDNSNDKEYAIRPKYGDKCWNELLRYRVNEIDI